MRKHKTQVILDEERLARVREIQIKLSGSYNLSGLIDHLLAVWILQEEAFLKMREKEASK